MDKDYMALVTMALVIFALLYGYKLEAINWVAKAKSGIRKEHKGKLYFVVEDGDKEALERIKNWMDYD